MDAAAHPHNPPNRGWRTVAMLGAVLFLCGYAALLWRHAGVVAAGSDSSGYVSLARLIREGATIVPIREVEGAPMAEFHKYAYVPLGYSPRVPQEGMVPTYPPGLPLFLAGAAALAGWDHGPALVMVLHALAGVVLVYAGARTFGLDPPLAAAGALLLAACPLYLLHSLQAMSDVPALVWVTAAVLLAWQARRHAAWGAAAGFAMGVAVLVRPTNILVALPVVLALGRPGRSWLAVGLGGLPAAVWLLTFNQSVYGAALTTGYGTLEGMFEAQWVAITLAHYAKWLPVLLTPVVLLALAFPFLRSIPAEIRLVLTGWVLAFLPFYAFYYHTRETWWYLRFILPAFPPLVIASLLVIQRWPAYRTPWIRRLVAAGLAAGFLANGAAWTRHWDVLNIGRGESTYRDSARIAAEVLPKDAVILAMQASGALFFYTDRTVVRWDFLPPHWARFRGAVAATGRPLCAVLFEFELEPALRDHTPGRWTRIHESGRVSYWRLEPEP